MGWYGHYVTSEEVLLAKEKSFFKSDYEILEKKNTKTWGMILLRTDMGEITLFSYIFDKEDESYKPIDFLNDENYFSRIPSSWLKEFTSKMDMAAIKTQKEILKKKRIEKAKEPKLDDILIPGNVYSVLGEDSGYFGRYEQKVKRTFEFTQLSPKNGGLVSYLNLKPDSVINLGSIGDLNLNGLCGKIIQEDTFERTYRFNDSTACSTWCVSVVPVFVENPLDDVDIDLRLKKMSEQSGESISDCMLKMELGAYEWSVTTTHRYEGYQDVRTKDNSVIVLNEGGVTEDELEKVLTDDYEMYLIWRFMHKLAERTKVF